MGGFWICFVGSDNLAISIIYGILEDAALILCQCDRQCVLPDVLLNFFTKEAANVY